MTRPIEKEDRPSDTNHRDDTILYWKDFGRIDIRWPKIPQDILDKIFNNVKEILKDEYPVLTSGLVIYAEYSTATGGQPKLNAHFDISQARSLILDYQLESNTLWGIGVEDKIFDLKDNSGILFDPTAKIHYRPQKNFLDGEFVKLLFFRFDTAAEQEVHTEEDWLRLYNLAIKNGDSV